MIQIRTIIIFLFFSPLFLFAKSDPQKDQAKLIWERAKTSYESLKKQSAVNEPQKFQTNIDLTTSALNLLHAISSKESNPTKEYAACFTQLDQLCHDLRRHWEQSALKISSNLSILEGNAKMRALNDIRSAISNAMMPMAHLFSEVPRKYLPADYLSSLHAIIKDQEQQIQQISNQIRILELYHFSIEKAHKANNIIQTPYRLKDIKEAIEAKLSAAKLFEEAASDCLRAISMFSLGDNSNILGNTIQELSQMSVNCKADALALPFKEEEQKKFLKRRLASLKEENALSEAKGNLRTCLETNKNMLSILQELIEVGEADSAELLAVQIRSLVYETLIESQRFEIPGLLSNNDFAKREEIRRQNFFKSISPQTKTIEGLQNVVPLDGQKCLIPDLQIPFIEKSSHYILFDNLFYRFFVTCDYIPSYILVKVQEKNRLVLEEKIPLENREYSKSSQTALDA